MITTSSLDAFFPCSFLLLFFYLAYCYQSSLFIGFYDHELPIDNFSRGVFKRKNRFPWMRGNRQGVVYLNVTSSFRSNVTHAS